MIPAGVEPKEANMTKAIEMIAIIAMCAAASVSHAAPSAAKVPGGISTDALRAFRAMDTDGDGYISRAEAAKDARTSQLFDAADRDRNGKLDIAEFKSALPT